MYQVFLSHSSMDKPAVELLARRLRDEAGLNPFLDAWHLVPGASWQPALEQALSESETVAVFFGPSGTGPWENEELQLALVHAVGHRDDFRVIPVLLPGAHREQIGGFLGLRTWVDFSDGLDSQAAFSRLVAGIQGRAPSEDSFRLPDEPAPYRGLLAFDEAHSDYFFGRGPDITHTLEKLGRERFVAVVGPSGCGKSSLVLGGVLPRLKRPGGLLGPGGRTWTLRPGNRPLRALADALASSEAPVERRLALADSLHSRFIERPDGLRTALASLTADVPGPCVLVVDQLEELFTLAPEHGGRDEVRPFVSHLRDATLEGSGTLRILVTLRADFLDRCLALAPLRELLQDRDVLLGSLGEEGLRDVILRPAQKVGAYLEKGLLSAILKDVSREPGALPLLEDALDQLWRARHGAWLTLAAYEASGGISQALQRRAQACYEALPPEEREVARLLLVRLTSLGEGREDTRRRIPRSELAFPGIPEARVEHVLRALSGPGARLIVVDQDGVEVAHEILIRTWPTLRKWLDEDRRALRVQRRLAEAAGEWSEKGREASYLYQGARLLEAEELFKQKPALLNQRERQFLQASILLRDQSRREEEERTKRELEAARRLTLVLSVAIVAALVFSALLYRQFQRAEKEKRVALSRELVLSARQNLREDPQRALLLLQEAQRHAPVDNLGEILDAWSQESCLFVLRGHRAPVGRATFSPDGSRVLTTSEDGAARLWDASSGKLLASLLGHTELLVSARFSPDGSRVLTASLDGTARLWDASSGKLLASFLGHSEQLESASFSPDGARVLTASTDGTARLWEASSGKLLVPPLDHSAPVESATFSPDGARILTASADSTARLWDASSGKPLATLRGHTRAVWSASFSPDGSRIVTLSVDGTARLWEASSGKPLALWGDSHPQHLPTFSPDGSRVLTASADGTVRLWDTSSGKLLASLLGHSELVESAMFSPDGTRVLTASVDSTARLWDAASGKPLASLPGHSAPVVSATFSPDGARILTASRDSTARLWDAASGKPLVPPLEHSAPVVSATFSPDGARVLTTSEERTARLWDAASGKPLASLPGHAKVLWRATFSPDGSRVLAAARDGTARLWDAASGKPLVSLPGHSDPLSPPTFSPDGSRVLTTPEKGPARLWDAASGKPLASLPDSSAPVESASFSPDGARIVTTSRDSTARLWDAASGKPLISLPGHSMPVGYATFSPDGARVLTASLDGSARLWDASSGEPLALLPGHSQFVRSATFSLDGSRVLIASLDGSVRLWPSWRWDPEAFAKLDVGRTFTCEERRTFLHEDISCPEESEPPRP